MNKRKRHVADIEGTTITAIQNTKTESRREFEQRVDQLLADHAPPTQPTEPTT